MAFACVKNNDAGDKLRYYVFLVKPKSDDGNWDLPPGPVTRYRSATSRGVNHYGFCERVGMRDSKKSAASMI